MRKALFGLLVLLLVSIAIAAMAWDTRRRAEVALAAHESRVSQDIASLRSSMRRAQAAARGSDLHRSTLAYLRSGSPRPNPDFDWMTEVMHPDSRSIAWMLKDWCDSGIFYPYEEAGAKIAIWASWSEASYSSPERILVALGTSFEFSRGDSAAWAIYSRRLCDEGDLLGQWRSQLADRSFSAHELRRMAAEIELLWRCRPTLDEAISAEYIYLSRSLFCQIRHPERSFTTDQERLINPGWRSLWSRKLLAAQLLSEYEDDLRRLGKVNTLPVHKRLYSVSAEVQREPLRNRELQQDVCGLYQREGSALLKWALARVATAVARYQAEQGVFPTALDALVPRYLDRIPECPESGHPFLYDSGEVSALPRGRENWKVKPR